MICPKTLHERATLVNLARTLAILAAGLVSAGGCGRPGLEKVIVSGDVRFDGQPVANGEILFYPTAGTSGPVSGASIRDGHYTADGKRGVPVGKHEVRIQGFAVDDAAKQVLAQNPDAAVGRRQFIPAKYNAKSELTLEVPPGSGSLEANFDLSP